MKDSKINHDRKPLTEQEVKAAEDFQDVMKRYKASQPSFLKKYGTYVGVALILGAITIFVLPDNHEEEQTTQANNQTNEVVETKVINPPLNGLDIAMTSNMVNADQGGEIDFPGGSVVKVPPHGFLDQNGDPVSGEVELRFREFHDLAEIFASGIPMTYDSAGVEYHFESAGMFEIDAYQNGEKLQANPNAPIRVELASNQQGNHYNLYFLDDKGDWHFIAKDTAHGSPSFMADTMQLANVPDQIKRLEKEKKNLKKEIDKSNKALERLIDGNLIPEPRLANNDLYSFVLDTRKEEFPELELFKNVLFEVTEENKDFSAEMMQLEWDDMVMKKHNKSGYKMTLYKDSKKETLFVRPVFSKATIGEAQKQYQALFEQYDLTLGGKLSAEKNKRDSLKMTFRAITDSVEQLNYYISDEYQRQIAIGNTVSKVTRVFEVDQFGFFNSDCPQNLPKGREIEPLFVDLKKITDTLCFTNIYLAELDKNTMYTIWGYWGEQKEGEEKVWVSPTISYNPNNKTVMWGVTSENKLAVFKPAQFEQLAKGGEVDLSMNISNKKVTDLEELRKLLGMI